VICYFSYSLCWLFLLILGYKSFSNYLLAYVWVILDWSLFLFPSVKITATSLHRQFQLRTYMSSFQIYEKHLIKIIDLNFSFHDYRDRDLLTMSPHCNLNLIITRECDFYSRIRCTLLIFILMLIFGGNKKLFTRWSKLLIFVKIYFLLYILN